MAKEKKEEMKADVASADEVALDRVLKALNMSRKDLDEIERNKVASQEMVDYDITPQIVYINGQAQPCRGRVTRAVAEVIMSMAGAARNRIIEEVLGKKGLAVIRDGVIRAEIVPSEVENVNGQVVSR